MVTHTFTSLDRGPDFKPGMDITDPLEVGPRIGEPRTERRDESVESYG